MKNTLKATMVCLTKVATVFFLLTLAAAPVPAVAQSGSLVVAQSSDVLTLDPSLDTSPISLNIFKNIYDQLTDIAADGSVKSRSSRRPGRFSEKPRSGHSPSGRM